MAYNVPLEDSSPLIIYEPAGAWKDTPQDYLATCSYSGSSVHTTATQGASLSFSFNGTGVWLYGTRRPEYGTYSVSIDGQPVFRDNASSSTPAFQQLLGAATGLEMSLHQVTLTNTGSLLDPDYMVFEIPVSEDITTLTFDDTDRNISYDSRRTAGDRTGCYNNTIHTDASIQHSFDGDAIAIYGTVSPSMGNYLVNLDDVEHQLNGGSNRASRALPEQTLLYFANNIGAQSHNLVITVSPSGLGDPSLFELDAFSVLSTSSSADNSVPDASSGAFLPLSTSSSSNSKRDSSPVSNSAPASKRSIILTHKALIAAAVSASVICLLAIAFLLLFCWKRNRYNSRSYKNMEKNKRTKPLFHSPTTPRLPIQDVEEQAGFDDGQKHPRAFRGFSPYASYHGSILSRYSSEYRPESDRTMVLGPVRVGHRRNGSDMSELSDSGSIYSSTSDDSCRILIKGVLMPPQFSTPRMPVPSVAPLRPSRIRDTMQIPF